MGTSTSSRGPNSKAPFVPPWADVDEQGPGPEPVPKRFQDFRRSLGRFVATGSREHLRAAIGSYARKATGGSTVGPRRFGSMVQAGAELFSSLASFRDGRDTDQLSLGELSGKDTDIAIDIIVNALVPENGDADRVRAAMVAALSECLEGYEEFDFSHISDEMLVEVMLAYVRQCVFEQIILDSNSAFARGTTEQMEVAENDLLSLVESVADKHMRPLLSGNLRSFTRSQIESAQLEAIKEIWIEWEGYCND